MPRRFPRVLGRIVDRLATLSPPRYRELVRGMRAELDSIADPGERTRFALGAIAAIARLALSGYSRSIVHAPGRSVLRRHAIPFAVWLASLTGLLLANQAVRLVPDLSASGEPAGVIVEVLLLTLPHTFALTVPMAVFLAVSWVFTRLSAEGVLASARRQRYGVRRLLAPVLVAAAVIAGLTFVSNSQIVPRTNARLAAVLTDAQPRASDRTMTIGELRDAAQRALSDNGPYAAARAAAYEVEVQKKFALAFACIFLALAGAAIALRFPRGRAGLVIGGGVIVFTGYYLSLAAGESLADRQVITPFFAMWMANAVLLTVALLLIWRPRGPGAARGIESLAIGG